MKTLFKVGVLVPTILFLLACTAPQVGSVSKFDESSVREAVFAHMVDHWKHREWPVTLFVSLGNEDADRAFVAEHSNLDTRVRSATEYSHGAGVMCSMRKITPISPTEVLVEGGYTYSLEGAEHGTFTVKLVNGRWLVTRWKVEVVA